MLKPGLKAGLYLPGNAAKAVPARFLTMAGGVNASTRTIVTEFVVDNPQDDLPPGAYVSVRMSFPSNPGILVFPTQALLFRADGMRVAILGAGNATYLQPVTVGQTLGLRVQVTSSLSVSDRIIASPSLGLLEGHQVEAVVPTPGSGSGNVSPAVANASPSSMEGTTETKTASSAVRP